jgi:hypothetical protein
MHQNSIGTARNKMKCTLLITNASCILALNCDGTIFFFEESDGTKLMVNVSIAVANNLADRASLHIFLQNSIA